MTVRLKIKVSIKINLNGQTFTGPQGDRFNIKPLQLEVMFQPIHSIGVIGIGPFLNYTGTSLTKDQQGNKTTIPASLQRTFSLGLKAVYQFNYSSTQLIVPIAGYEVSRTNYSIKGTYSGRGNIIVHGPVLGTWVNLGALDPHTLRTAVRDIGLERAFLTIEAKKYTGSDSWVNMSNLSLNIGLRLEF